MKKIIQVFVLLFFVGFLVDSTIASDLPFNDVETTHPYYTAINYLADSAIVNGNPDGTFGPDQPLNRAAALKMILKTTDYKASVYNQLIQLVDVPENAWFYPYFAHAFKINILNGNPDGTFRPDHLVNRAEFLKMLLLANGIQEKVLGVIEGSALDVPEGAWFAPYLNYALKVGLIQVDSSNRVKPNQLVSRGEAADIIYLLKLVRSVEDTQFLLNQAKSEMSQIELYIKDKNIHSAKRSSELAVDLTQQAYINESSNSIVISAAKLARAYDWLVDTFILAIKGDKKGVELWANKAIDKATEAWEFNHDLQKTARYIKDQSRFILRQMDIGG